MRENRVIMPAGRKMDHVAAQGIHRDLDAVPVHRNAVFHPLPGKIIGFPHPAGWVIIKVFSLNRPDTGKLHRTVLPGELFRLLPRRLLCNGRSAAFNIAGAEAKIDIHESAGFRVKHHAELLHSPPSAGGTGVPIQSPDLPGREAFQFDIYIFTLQ
ncbi:MAG: hypothetical protein K6T59_13290 [Bryobacteraceae bacterium]|nr:hypothetical protein [Bryobacteraceae bacterium]